MGGDLPSFALLSSPSRECFLAMQSNTESSVRSDIEDSVAQDVRVIRVVDDGLCWTITSHPIIRGINSRRVSTTNIRIKMAGPPEERQKQLIYERERAREAVCMII